MEMQQVRVLAEGLAFPEGPVAMPDGSVLVVEMLSGRLSRVSRQGKVSVVAEVGGGPNGAAVGPDGAIYVCNNGGFSPESASVPCIQRVDIETGTTDVLYTEAEGQKLAGPNDLVFDSTGAFWFTDYRGDAIYYARADGSAIHRADARAFEPNGIGLSPQGDILYWAQTRARQVHRRRLAGPGEMVASSGFDMSAVMRGTPDRWSLLVGLPGASDLDSLAIDSTGAVCVGTLVDSGITVVQPEDGSYQLHTLPQQLADGAVTNICFGGEDLRTAYLTCSATGRLVACRWPHPGLQLAFQQLPSAG